METETWLVKNAVTHSRSLDSLANLNGQQKIGFHLSTVKFWESWTVDYNFSVTHRDEKRVRWIRNLEGLARWKLGLPIFEVFWLSLFWVGVLSVLLLPFIHWIRSQVR